MKRLISIGIYLISCICLVAQTTKTYTVSFDKNDFIIKDYNQKKIITSPVHNLAFDKDTTLPAIPYKIINILLPENEKLKNFSYTIGDTLITQGISLSTNPIYITTDMNPDSISFPKTYYQLKDYPLEVKLLSEQTLECYRYASFKVPVCSYNAISKVITWACDINITIETQTCSNEIQYPTRQDVITDILQNILFNPNELYIPSIKTNNRVATPTESENIKYLIITSDNLKNSFIPFANWKTTKGIKAKIVTTEEIYTEYASETISNQLKIKQCIYDYYTKGLEYVLLGGDETIIPVQKCYGTCTAYNDSTVTTKTIPDLPTDLFYANLTGNLDWNADGDNLIGEINDNNNFYPNIAIGRFPIKTIAQANLLIQKSIYYDKNPPLNNWSNRMLLTGANLYEQENMAGQCENLFNTYIQPYWSNVEKTRFYDTDTDFEGGENYELTSTNLQEQINNGYHHIFINCHGSESDFWLEQGTYSTNHANSLTNSSPTFIVTNACHTNAFDKNILSLGEAFMRATNGKIMAYLGTTRENIGSRGTILGPSSLYHGEFYKNIFSSQHQSIGEALKNALTSIYSQHINENEYRWVLYSLTLLGDPELQPYTQNPQKITNITWGTAGGSSTWVDLGTHALKATITSKNDNGASYCVTPPFINSSSTEVSFDIEQSQWGNYQLCITGKNHIPLLITDMVGTYIQNQTFNGSNTITGKDIYIGKDVTKLKEEGPVIIESGSTTFDATNSVTIKNGFECKKGAVLEIK